MPQQKKIWKLQHTTICKVVGMALDLEDLKRIARKFHLSVPDSGLDEDFAFHSAMVGLCGKESHISRHVHKLIEKRFSRYAKRLVDQNALHINELTNATENGGVPLWAILWHLGTTCLDEGERLETALFGRIHMLEHKLVKDFWHEAGEERDKRETEQREEINSLRSEIIRLQSLNAKSEKLNQGLTARLNQANAHCLSSPAASMIDSPGLTFQEKKIERLKLLLDESRKRNIELDEECAQSKKQIEALTQELLSHEVPDVTANDTVSPVDAPSSRLTHCLRGKRIAMVGGFDSLEAHYKSLVEQSGGQFCRHDGRCCRGERRLEECIRNADLVVCPIGVNSHFGALGVKKVCRKYGINCCFPDSAGLGSLRTTLLQHFTSNQERPEETALP